MTKYHSKTYGGYASKREAEIATNLHVLLGRGEISDLKEQVRYSLLPRQRGKSRNERGVTYVADFVYLDKEGIRHVCDAKGYKTPVYVLKRKLLMFLHKIEVEEL